MMLRYSVTGQVAAERTWQGHVERWMLGYSFGTEGRLVKSYRGAQKRLYTQFFIINHQELLLCHQQQYKLYNYIRIICKSTVTFYSGRDFLQWEWTMNKECCSCQQYPMTLSMFNAEHIEHYGPIQVYTQLCRSLTLCIPSIRISSIYGG